MELQDRRQLALQVRIGIFVLASLAVLIGFVYLLGARARLFEPTYDLVADFTEVGGLVPGATVRLAGVQIGRVTHVRLPEAPGEKVRVTLTIARRFADRIRKDSVARIETQGLLGDKLVEISLGSQAAPALKRGESIIARDPVELSRLAGEGFEVLKHVATLSGNLNTTVEAFNKAGTLDDLSATLRSTRRFAERMEKRDVLADLAATLKSARATAEQVEKRRVLDDLAATLRSARATAEQVEKRGVLDDLAATLRSARATAEQVEKGRGWLHALVYEEPEALRRLQALLAATERLVTQAERGENAVSVLLAPESGRSARRLLEAIESLGEMTDKAKGSDSFLATLLFDPQYKGVADDLRALSRNFREVSERLAQGKGLVGGLLTDAGDGPLGEAARDFKVAVANLRLITDRLAAGEGTLGGLLEDPTVYENLAAFLEGAKRSTFLRYLIRSAIERGAR